ncbi:hypothetical protein Droror1_Dr00012641 [Drosera rotundifolia]
MQRSSRKKPKTNSKTSTSTLVKDSRLWRKNKSAEIGRHHPPILFHHPFFGATTRLSIATTNCGREEGTKKVKRGWESREKERRHLELKRKAAIEVRRSEGGRARGGLAGN